MNTMNLTEIENLLGGSDDSSLFSIAHEVRKASFGTDVFLRGVVEFSNYCTRRCLYCGLRNNNSAIRRYRLDTAEILEAAFSAPEMGIGTVVLQSGDDYHYTREIVGHIVREIKKRYDVAVTLSLGDRSKDDYQYWRDCGADRYLLKVETFQEKLHKRLRPGQSLKDRLERLSWLQNLGYEVGSGIIVGLPGMECKSLAGDIVSLSRLNLEMIAVGPFVPHPETPLHSESPGDLLASYRTMAILRILNPLANIPATSALDVLAENGKAKALRCGANVVMPSITPESVRRCYNIYPGKNTYFIRSRDEVRAVRTLIYLSKLDPSSSKGFSAKDKT